MYYVINTNLFLFFLFAIYMVISMSPSLLCHIILGTCSYGKQPGLAVMNGTFVERGYKVSFCFS